MEKQLQMFLLPFAGGSSVSFKKLEPFLDPRIDALTVEYAGRMTRRREPFIEDYDSFLNDAAQYIRARRNPDIPFALFGYSLGSVLLYDLLSRKMVEGEPKHAFICAKGSLLAKRASQDYCGCPDESFVREIMALGGTDERIFHNKRFLSIYMQPVRADYIIWGQYSFRPGSIPCDATAIYSRKDPASEGVHDWEKNVDGKIDFFELGTNHFFINQYWQDVADIVNRHLAKHLHESRR